MCWRSATGFPDLLSLLWDRLRGNRPRTDSNPRPDDDQHDRPTPVQPEPDQPAVDHPLLHHHSATDLDPRDEPGTVAGMGDRGERLCTPCGGMGRRMVGEAYCVDCKDYLCGECVKYHKVLSVTKDHELIQVGDMEDGPPTSAKDRPTQVCERHEEEVVKYYCPLHDRVGCQVCITLDHRECKGVVYIQEVAKDILDTQEYSEFDASVRNITESANNLARELAENAEHLDKCTDEAVSAIKAVRTKLNGLIDRLESDLQSKAVAMGQEEVGKIGKVAGDVNTVLSEIVALTDQIDTFKLNTENCNLYMIMKKLKSGILDQLETDLRELERRKGIRLFNFQPNVDLFEMLEEASGLGQLRLRIQHLEHSSDIRVRSDTDHTDCSITGSAMMSNCRLVVTDHSNRKVKLIDIRRARLTSELELTSAPWDCTGVSGTEVVVSLPNEKKVVLVKIEPELKFSREIPMGDICRGVAFDDDNLIVTFPQQNEIRIMDMHGAVSKTISTDEHGAALFDKPSYVSIRPETDVIYVTNWNSDRLVCLRMDGTVVKVFTDKELKCPEQVVVDSNGLVYFCGCISHNIYQLTADCELIKIIVSQAEGLKNGLRNPYSISYSSKTDMFYVGMQSRDVVKVYRAL